MDQKLTNYNFPFLKNLETETIGIYYKSTFTSYAALLQSIEERSRELGDLNGVQVVVAYESFLTQLTNVLAVIAANGSVLSRREFIEQGEGAKLSEYCESYLLLSDKTEDTLENDLLAVKRNANVRGGVLLSLQEGDTFYSVDIATAEEHIAHVVQAYDWKQGDTIAIFEQEAFDDILEFVLPAMATNANISIGDTAEVTTAAWTTLKMHTAMLGSTEIAEFAKATALQVDSLVISSTTPLHKAHITWLFDQFSTVSRIKCTFQLETTGLSVMEADWLRREEVFGDVVFNKPFGKSGLKIVDAQGSPSPIGVPGELWIGASCLSLPLHEANSAAYRAIGYKARFLASGGVEILHRSTREIITETAVITPDITESYLTLHPFIESATVLFHHNSQQLTAFVVVKPEKRVSKAGLKAWLKKSIAKNLVPTQFEWMAALPLTTSKAIAYQTLQEYAVSVTEQLAASPVEQALIGIWEEVLGVEGITQNDNFFELGGHSLAATKLVGVLRKQFNTELSIRTVFTNPTIQLLAGVLAMNANEGSGQAIVAHGKTSEVPLSFGQQRVWFIDQLQGTRAFHISGGLLLKGAVQTELLAKALKNIVEKHQVLRTVMQDKDGVGYQSVIAADAWELTTLSSEGDADTVIASLADRPFDLTKDYMFRAGIQQLEENEYLLALVFHHIACDGWSIPVFVEELTKEYEALSKGETAATSLPIQYTDYALWQKAHLNGAYLANQLNYWEEQLQGVTPLLLPTDIKRPKEYSSEGAVLRMPLSSDLTTSIALLSTEFGCTPFMSYLAVFKVLLYRYTSQKDICVGIPMSGRTHQEFENLIGFFVNTIAIRNQLTGNLSFETFLEEVKETALAAYKNQEAPFEQVIERLGDVADSDRNPFLKVLFSVENMPVLANSTNEHFTMSVLRPKQPHVQSDVHVIIEEDTEEGWVLEIQYRKNLFHATTIEQFAEHYRRLLASVIENPAESIGHLAMLSKDEKRELVLDFNTDRITVPGSQTVFDLLSKRAQQTPEAIALVFGTSKMSYASLEQKSNQVARYLKAKGVQKGDLVPICMERSLMTMVAIFGIMKSGAAYVPIDPTNPVDRISFIISDVAAKLVVTHSEVHSKLQACSTVPCMVINELDAEIHEQSSAKVEMEVHSDDIAYVIYTSGTTGKPKGAMMRYGSLWSFLESMDLSHPLSEGDAMAFKTNYGFDMTIPEIFGWIKRGATCVLIADEQVKEVGQFVSALQKHRVTQLLMVPSHFSVFIEYVVANDIQLPDLRYLLVGGETFPEKALALFKASKLQAKLDNIYGPTETTVFVLFERLNALPEEAPEIPIGKPMPNTEVYIVSEEMELVPKGVVGELCVGGLVLSKGYLNRTDLTEEKFVTNPFRKGERLYKSGDLARWLPDGSVGYVGRKDSQVKIRGYRVELGEIENVLGKHPAVQQGAVTTAKDQHGSHYLIGYTTLAEAVSKEELQEFLAAKLPEYMVPKIWVTLESMPLSVNGKIDKKKLPAPVTEALSQSEFVAPVTELEKQLARIWSELLEVENIGVHDNFFELGGHSLLATRVVSRIRKELEKELAIKELFVNPTIASLAQALDEDKAFSGVAAIVKRDPQRHIPLSFSQQRMWFLDQMQGTREYHISGGLRITGTLDLSIAEQAFKQIVARHEVLRTVIYEEAGTGYQKCISPENWKLEFSEQFAESKRKEAIDAFLDRPFDLAKDYMFRACAFPVSEGETIVALVFHHIASDGWSIPVFIDEFQEIYATLIRGEQLNLPALPIQYADYAVWQHQELAGSLLAEQLNYWENKLQGVTPLNLPTDFVRPTVRSRRGANCHYQLDQQLSAKLTEFSQAEGTTLFMTLLAAFKVLLHKYSGQGDICVGTPIANRLQAEMEHLIGFFVNTLALRSEVATEQTFKEFLQTVKETTLDSYENQLAPFDKVVEKVGDARDLSITQVFQVMFDLHNIPENKKLALENTTLTPFEFEEDTAQFDLILVAKETLNGIFLDMEYSTDLFTEATVNKMLRHFEVLLYTLLENQQQKIAGVSVLTPEERIELIYDFNATEVDYPLDKTFVDLFAEQAAKSPYSIAALCQGASLTYKDLDERSNQVAHFLKQKGVGKDEIVAVCSERTFDLLIAVVGIMKAGAAYVPMKPDFPESRMQHILTDTKAKWVLSDTATTALLATKNTLQATVIDVAKHEAIETASKLPVLTDSNPDSLGYVIFTSGSTGTPKGALIEQKGLVNHLLVMIDTLELDEHSVIAFTAPFTFDISVWQLLCALLTGGRTAIYDEKELLDVNAFGASLHHDGVSVLQLVPSYTASLLAAAAEHRLDQLEYFLVTGEAVTKDILDTWFSVYPDIPVVNAYGPAEAADDVTLHIMRTAPADGLVPIGKPVANMQIYVVDAQENLCPVGVIGEICVGGVGVGRGYLNLDALTREKFGPNPFSGRGRMYKTGDLGRWLSDGTLEFVGRADDQVKIRGHRIELGEIENTLTQASLVKSACVLAKDDGAGVKNLVSYVVLNAQGTKEDLENFLAARIPEYMIPKIWVFLNEMPLTPNGKIAKRDLPDPADVQEKKSDITEKLTPVQQKIKEIWIQLLGLDELSIHDNFFELGGHSLKVVSMVSQIQKELEADIAISDIFSNPTIAGLSALIDTAEEIIFEAIPKVAEAPYYPVSNAQKRLWILDRFVEEVSGYNSYNTYKIEGALNVEAFSEAVTHIVNRHEVLRTTFTERQGEPVQVIHKEVRVDQVVDLIDCKEKGITEAEILQELEVVANTPFDLSAPYLFKSRIYQLSETEFIFFCAMHHIICDGWSNTILVKEILKTYQARSKQQELNLPSLAIQYKDYAAWQVQQLASGGYDKHKEYWHQKLQSPLPVLDFPTYKLRPAVQDFSGKAMVKYFDTSLLHQIKALAAQEETSLFMVLTSFLNVLLFKYTGQTDIIIGTGTAGRTHPDLENQLGYYISTVALRNQLDPTKSFKAFLKEVSANTIEAFEHQDYPFDMLVNELDIERDISRNPIFDIMLQLQSYDEDEDELLINGFDNVRIAQLEVENQGSPFDMDFDFAEEKDTLKLLLTYNDSVYEEAQMQQLLEHLELLMHTIVANPDEKTAAIGITTAAEQAMIADFNATEKTLPLERTYHHYLEEFAEKTPEKTAVIFEDKETSYAALNAQANQLARALAMVEPLVEDDQVGILLERSDTLMAMVLGVWKLGGAYIPIDKKVPANRVLSMIEIAELKAVIVDRDLVSVELQQRIASRCTLLFIQDLITEATQQQAGNLNREINPNSLSVTMFTSGSTGLPKGAMNEHIGMMNHALATVDYLNMDADAVLVQNASLSFDIAVWQFFTALITGGTTAIYGDALVNSPTELLQKFVADKVSVFQVVPSYLGMLLELIEEEASPIPLTISHLICCGEAVNPKAVQRWLNLYPNTIMINDYGPAEASDGTTWNVFNAVDDNALSIPVGKPIYNMANYIVDDYMNLCPVGVVGEICVAGVGVGRGYINEPEKTAQAFVDNPFKTDRTERLYKTGDLGRVLPNGMIEFRGRKDYQVKVNGQRIELGEIESKLEQVEGVKAITVIHRSHEHNDRKYLHAFVVFEEENDLSIEKLKNILTEELPPYMIPSDFQELAQLPLTMSGKVDRKYLDSIAESREVSTPDIAVAEGAVETILVTAWKKVLNLTEVSTTDNFYHIGGDSISAIQVASFLYKNALKVDVKDIMRYPTIKEVAIKVVPLEMMADQGVITGSCLLTPIQKQFFTYEKTHPNHYNQSMVLRSKQRLDLNLVKEALYQVQCWHDALRSVFTADNGVVKQQILDVAMPVSVTVHEVLGEQFETALNTIGTTLQASIQLEEGPLTKAALVRTDTADYLMFAIHHLVIDGVSWRIVLEDFAAVYEQLNQGKPIELPAKTHSFLEWSDELRAYMVSEKFETERAFWMQRVENKVSRIAYTATENQLYKARVKEREELGMSIGIDQVKVLETEVHQAFNTGINDILLAALSWATSQSFGLQNTPVMLESHGRADINPGLSTNRTVGWFTSEYPVYLPTAYADLAVLIKEVKEHLHQVPNNGIGFGIMKYLDDAAPEEIKEAVLPQIAFNYLGKIEDDGSEEEFVVLDTTYGHEEALENKSDFDIELLGTMRNGQLQFTLQYHSSQFKRETMESWLETYKNCLEKLIAFCASRSHSEATPSDYDYKDLSLDDLVELNDLF